MVKDFKNKDNYFLVGRGYMEIGTLILLVGVLNAYSLSKGYFSNTYQSL